MGTLTVIRTRYSSYHIETIFKDCKGAVKKIDNSFVNPLKYGSKSIVIRGVTYNLIWAQNEKTNKKDNSIKTTKQTTKNTSKDSTYKAIY